MHPPIYSLVETITAEDEASRPPRPPKESTLGLKVWSPAKKPEYGVPKIWGTFQGFCLSRITIYWRLCWDSPLNGA